FDGGAYATVCKA
ncbi:hypothetical protein JV197_19745, partial [Vibrio furnissii]